MYNCNIVVIDDDNVMLDLVQNILENLTSGDICILPDSKQALKYVQSNDMEKVSLVICDWLMPNVCGLEILAQLRKFKPDCPCLMLTANATKQFVVDSMRLGATDFIVKPFHANELLTKVERIIRDADLG